MPRWIALGFQDIGSITILELTRLHDYVIVIIVLVVIVISYILGLLLLRKFSHKFLVEGGIIETIWSVIPALILILLVVPSIKVLYLIEDFLSPRLRVKVVGHQWYWTYVVPILNSVKVLFKGQTFDHYEFDSFIEPYETNRDYPRLLGCSEFLTIPAGTTTRFIITSTDVIHAFTVPTLGLKVDAVPGRINQLVTTPLRLGTYFGQCSEICGSNHSFIPIGVEIVDLKRYEEKRIEYLLSSISEYI